MRKALFLVAALAGLGGMAFAQAPNRPPLGASPPGMVVAAEPLTVEGTVAVKSDDAGNVVGVAIVPATGEEMPVRLNEKGKQLVELKGRTVKASGIVVKGMLYVATAEEVKKEAAGAVEVTE